MGFFGRIASFFNRKKQEEEVRKEQKKWWQFWKRKAREEPMEEPEPVPEVEEVEETPWRVDSQSLMDEAEKRKREAEEAAEKAADEEKKRQQYEKARDTANRRYGTNFTQEEYDKIWDFYGNNPDIAEYFPSEDIIYAGEFAKQNKIPFNRFIDIIKEAAQEAAGRGLNRQEASQILWSKLDREVAAAQNSETYEEEFYD